MAKLIYAPIMSLDGYVEDAEGKSDWAPPDEELHSFVNVLERPVGTYLLGRRMYETMVFWESPPDPAAQPSFVQDFAQIWQAADKIVYSKTLRTVTSDRTRLEREFNAPTRTSARIWNWWRNAPCATARFTSATARGPDCSSPCHVPRWRARMRLRFRLLASRADVASGEKRIFRGGPALLSRAGEHSRGAETVY